MVSAIRISQVVAFSRTHSVHLNPRIEGTEKACPQFSGGRFCQVVARTDSTVSVIHTAHWICALQFADFFRLCLSPRTTSRTISFLFPIVFGINLIPFCDIGSLLAGLGHGLESFGDVSLV